MCGFTQPMDVREAVRSGVDLVGLNFHSGSPRAVSFGLAQRLCEGMKEESQRRKSDRPARSVAIFVDPDEEMVRDVIDQVAPDVLQFHGNEEPEFCQSFKRPFLKAFRIQSVADAARVPEYSGGWSIGYLVDAWSGDAHGGTGRSLGIDTARAAMTE
ncbi:MAG: phosphoribosylanthranilate isomerase, partial [Myxococcota bacterium]|nr:phosphoribosylanthranilate isomerase [Myxococcota bacterium]